MAGKQSGATVGIDLGTTYSAVASVEQSGHVDVLPSSEGKLTTRSTVFFDGDTVLVGDEAAKAALLEPENGADCFKRDMGQARYARKVCGKYMRPEALSAIILRKLKQDAERRIGPIRDAVITVPAYFDDVRRKATQDAGKIAGLNVIGIINEPTAAALCYGYGRKGGSTDERIFLVYDLGGGTFDATLMRVAGENEFATVATDGDVLLGGKDWDERVLDYVAGEFMRKAGADPRDDPMSYQELACRVEECKRTLTKRKSVIVPVAHIGQRIGVPLERAKFRDLTADLLARTQTTIELLAAEAQLTWEQVDTVLLAGGSSRMSMVGEMISKVTGKPPDRGLEEDVAIAKGAAIYAASLQVRNDPAATPLEDSAADRLAGLRHQNVNAHSLGVAARRKTAHGLVNVIVIPRNTPLPVEKSRAFGLAKADATRVRIKVLEGDAPVPEACVQLGTCRITGLPRGLPKGSPVNVTFSYSEDGRVHVRAVARAAGVSASVEIDRPEGLNSDGLATETQTLAGLEVL